MFVGYRDLIIFRSPLIGGKEVHGANIRTIIFARKNLPYLLVNFYASPSERKERGEFRGKGRETMTLIEEQREENLW